MLSTSVQVIGAFVALYPIVTSAAWVAGGLLFQLLEDEERIQEPEGGWPAVTMLIPAYNEAAVIGHCIHAALSIDYDELEVLILDDGSTDDTVAAAVRAAEGHPQVEVIPDPVNQGKADRLNLGFQQARHELVLVCDADTHLHPEAVKQLVSRLSRSPLVAAVAGSPHVTNRSSLVAGLQILETASIIGLVRRTWALSGRVGVVAGVLGLFRRQAVLDVGGYDGRMATEDIDLSWRLLLAGWNTAYEPRALVGMQVPSTLRPLWAQRCRWARGQGEVLRTHTRAIAQWRNRRLWALVAEAWSSLLWLVLLVLAATIALITTAAGESIDTGGFVIGWGIAIAVIAAVQLAFAVAIQFRLDHRGSRALLLGPLFPLGYWIIAAAAALRSEVPSVFSGPREKRVVWNIDREDE